jgi:hypothetical protein
MISNAFVDISYAREGSHRKDGFREATRGRSGPKKDCFRRLPTLKSYHRPFDSDATM